jgi:hypothetical protein
MFDLQQPRHIPTLPFSTDVCAMSAFHPIATKLLHYGK